jgi:hypothetical protein
MHKTNKLDDGYMGSGKMLKHAIKKHGIENFTKEFLHIFDNEDDMKNKEKELVVLNEMSYNLCEGGKGGWSYVNRSGIPRFHGKSHTEKHKKHISEITKTLWKNEDYARRVREGVSIAQKQRYKNNPGSFSGKKHTEETKKKIGNKNSISQKGNLNSQYGTCWITNGYENRKVSKCDVDNWLEKGYRRGRIISQAFSGDAPVSKTG